MGPFPRGHFILKYVTLGNVLSILGLILDAFNVLNVNTATSVETLSNAANIEFEKTTAILDPRILRFGIRIWNIP